MSLRRVLDYFTPRALVRSGFFLFFLWTCWRLWQFYQWALGAGPHVDRPDAVAGFVPLGAFMSLIAWLKTGIFDPVLPAGVVIVLGAVALSVLFKRGFCGFICPVGTLASAFGWLGRRIRSGRTQRIPLWLDRGLRLPKIGLAAFILYTLWKLPAVVALQFQQIPYYATSDVKILYGLVHPQWWYLAIAAFALGTTVLIGTNTWCRYLCPLGALYGSLSAGSLSTVERDPRTCISCGACTEVCHARIDVAISTSAVRAPECDGCQDCTRVCPEPGALTARVFGIAVPWQFWPVLVVLVWLLVWAIAYKSGHWVHGLDESQIATYLRIMKITPDF